jgi:hypothetical protein
MSRLGAMFYRVIKGRADSGEPMQCASCKRPITDPERAIAVEIEENEFLVTCCELCTRREWKRSLGNHRQQAQP